MAKEKLFTPEDFDKPKDKGFWQKYKYWIIGVAALFIIAAIVLCCVFCGKPKEKNEKELAQDRTEQVAPDTENQVNNEDSIIVKQTVTQETEKEEEQTATTTIAKAPKEETKTEVTTVKPASQPANVSDNVEQEAINVIRGNYGNVPERREKLGPMFQAIQNRVNELKRQGAF